MEHYTSDTPLHYHTIIYTRVRLQESAYKSCAYKNKVYTPIHTLVLASLAHMSAHKISVESKDSLYLLRYSELDPQNSTKNEQLLAHTTHYSVHLYIDIPSIDYYSDELHNTRLAKFNRRFRIGVFRQTLWDAFANGNEQWWEQLAAVTDRNVRLSLTVSTAGSIRYVETVKFLVEALYKRITPMPHVHLDMNIRVSTLTRKWFGTFLNKGMLDSGKVAFLEATPMAESPFKEYFSKLSGKFANNVPDEMITQPETILIITNSTGIKALLTILSDRPLTNFLTQESIDEIFTSQGQGQAAPGTLPRALGHARSDSRESIKRESLSIMNFQNSILTSNKDKSVRVRSLSTNARPTYAPTNTGILNAIPLSTHNSSTNLALPQGSPSPLPQGVMEASDDEMAYPDEDDEDAEEEEEEDDDEDDEDDEDGISFYVPSLLSRTASSTNVPAETNASREYSTGAYQVASGAASTTMKKGRFRSLSLMDPALKAPFTQGATSDLAASRNNVNSRSFSNIYVHDGDFIDAKQKQPKRKRKYTLSGNMNNIPKPATGLIPPEFYSKMSSPSTSNNSSNNSLSNMFMSPNANGNNNNNSRSSSVKLFEKNLINNSLEEIRKINNETQHGLDEHGSPNHLLTSGEGTHHFKFPHKHAFGLMFNRPHHQPSFDSLDEEDRLMMGGGSDIDEKGDVEIETSDRTPTNSTSSSLNTHVPLVKITSTELGSQDSLATAKPKSTSRRELNIPSLNLQLYDSHTEKSKSKEEGSSSSSIGPHTGPPGTPEETAKDAKTGNGLVNKFKKVLSFDLYGDNDKDNNNFWMLGRNT